MKKSEIKVGVDYAVTNGQRQGAPCVRATVMALNVARVARTPGIWSSRTETKMDGVAVTFSEAVVAEYGSFRTLSSLEARGIYTDAALQKMRAQAMTEAVLTTREVAEEWEPYARRRDERNAALEVARQEATARQEEIQARMTAVGEVLADDGVGYEWRESTISIGGDRFLTNAVLTLDLEAAEQAFGGILT